MKTKKGETLIEIMISIFIFSIILVAAMATYQGIAAAKVKENEYLHFEGICLDIDKYYSRYNRDWSIYYFNDTEEQPIHYYSRSYQLLPDDYEAFYALSYSYDVSNGDLLISIKRIENNTYVMQDLNFGNSRNM